MPVDERGGSLVEAAVDDVSIVSSGGGATPTPTPNSDLIFADDFESGDTAAWSAEVDSEGDLNVTTAAALHGTYGLAALIDNTTAMYVRDDTPSAEPRYRARFYFDPNSISTNDGDQHVLFLGRSTSADAFQVQFRKNAGNYQVNIRSYDDAAGTTGSAWETISDASHYIEIDWKAATGAGANNGSLDLYIDGTLERTLSGIDNDTLRVDEVRLGPSSGLDSGTSGTYYLDGFESRRSTYIGPLAGLLPGGRSHLAALRQAQGRLLPQASERNPGFFARLTARMYRALAAAFLPGLAPAYAGVQPAAAVLSAPPAGQTLQVPSGQAWKTYYSAGGLVAMREITAGGSVLYYLHQDHLGSATLTTNSTGGEVARQLYLPYGGIRYATGTMPTDIGYTGQRADDTGLMHYGARYYSPLVGRFVSADTIVPSFDNSQSLNRYGYVLNNPLKYTDPTGHAEDPGTAGGSCGLSGTLGCGNSVGNDGPDPGELLGAAVVIAASILYEPIDYGITAVQCVTSGCTWSDIALTAVPGAWGALKYLDAPADAMRAVDTASDIVRSSESASDADIVYRVVRSEEHPNALTRGIRAKDPSRRVHPQRHVTHGNVEADNWISATRDPDWALKHQEEAPIYKIDLNKVKSPNIDTTKPGAMSGWHPIARRLAGRASEVLIDTYIPPEAIRGIIAK